MKTTKKLTPEQRFQAKVKKSDDADGCWLWTGYVQPGGYGSFGTWLPGRQKTIGAHRAAWIFANGPIPRGLQVNHRCDVRACVRVDHLWLGDQQANLDDMIAKGRSARGDKSPRRLHPEQYKDLVLSHVRGEAVATARLTDEHVIEIRKRYAAGELQKDISADLTKRGIQGASQPNVSRVCRGDAWKHVKEAA